MPRCAHRLLDEAVGLGLPRGALLLDPEQAGGDDDHGDQTSNNGGLDNQAADKQSKRTNPKCLAILRCDLEALAIDRVLALVAQHEVAEEDSVRGTECMADGDAHDLGDIQDSPAAADGVARLG